MEKTDKALWRAVWTGTGLALAAEVLALLEGMELRPVTALGLWLRERSLSGAGGDALAWAVAILLSLAPAAAVWLLLGRTRRRWADGLLPLTVLLAFAALFYAVNPTLGGAMGWLLPGAALSTASAAMLAWVVLRFLGALADAPRERLAAVLGVLLTGCGLLLVAAAAWSGFTQWQAGAEAVRAANTGAREAAERTVAVQGVLAVLKLLPNLLGAAALLWGGRLAGRLGADPFGEEALTLCGRTARLCRWAAGGTVLLELLAGVVQLMLFSSLTSTSFHLELNLLPLALTAALYLLCRWFQQGRALKADNDSII